MTLGAKLQKLRKAKGISQEELAARINVSRQAVSKWELDESKPDTDNVIRLSGMYGVTTDYLLNDELVSDVPAVNATAETTASEKRRDKRRALKIIACLLIGCGIAGILSMYTASRFVTARMEVESHSGEAMRELNGGGSVVGYEDAATPQEEGQSSARPPMWTYINIRGRLIPFLQTYHLELLFALCCISAVAGIVLLIVRKKLPHT
jgi:transcriptional regulator with XRE-family HTH domain